MSTFKYRAFISYSHADHNWGHWLHRKLEQFRTPKKMIGQPGAFGAIPPRLGRCFRDEAELGAAHALGPKIEEALAASDVLIVICSPNSATSQWVNQEIAGFKALGREQRVFALIVDGEPNAVDPKEECFPEALKWELDEAGKLTDEMAEPLAVDIRKFGRDDAVLRLVSGILDVDYDQLKQRDLIRQRKERRQTQALFVGGIALTAAAGVGGYFSMSQSIEASQKASQVFATKARELNQPELGEHEKAMLFALLGDPAATGNPFQRQENPNARAQLEKAYVNAALIEIIPENDGRSLEAEFPYREGRNSNFRSDTPLVSNDEKFLFEASRNDAILRDPASGEELIRLPHGERLTSFAFSPSGDRAITGSTDRAIKLWDTSSGELLRVIKGEKEIEFTIPLPGRDATKRIGSYVGHTDKINAIMFSPNGMQILSASRDGTAKIWSAETGDLIRTFPGHEDSVETIAFSQNGHRVLTETTGGKARVWRNESGLTNRFFPIAPDTTQPIHHNTISAAKYAPDGKQIVTGSHGGTLTFWDVDTLTPTIELADHDGIISLIEYTPDGSMLLTGSRNSFHIRNVATGEIVISFQGNYDPWVSFSPDGRFLLTSDDTVVSLRSVATGTVLKTFSEHRDEVFGLDFSPDGSRFVTSSADETIIVWDIESGEALNTFMDFEEPLLAVSYSDDGNYLLVASTNGITRLLSSETGEIIRPFAGHLTLVLPFFSPDGRRVVTASFDGTMKLWDLATGEALFTQSLNLSSSVNPLSGISISPDANSILVVDQKRGTSLIKLPEFLFADPRAQVQLACAKARSTGVYTFSQLDKSKHLILEGQPDNPCSNL